MNYNSIMKGLDEAVKISKGKMQGRRHTVTITPIQEFSNVEIKKLRNKLHLTQGAFAQLVGVSPKTIEAWEKGTNSPNGSARRILGMLKEDPKLPEKYHLIAR